jgi:hypothetical protein
VVESTQPIYVHIGGLSGEENRLLFHLYCLLFFARAHCDSICLLFLAVALCAPFVEGFQTLKGQSHQILEFSLGSVKLNWCLL